MPSLESLWNSTPFWSIISLIGGIIVSSVFFLAGRNRKILEYQITSTPLITRNVANISGLKVTINNTPVKTLTSTTIRFFNMSSVKIEPTDFAPLEPLGVSASSGILHLQLETDVGSHKSKNMNLRFELIDNKTANIAFDFLRPKTNFSITVMHEGNLLVSGDLKGGKVRAYSKDSSAHCFMTYSLSFLALISCTMSIKPLPVFGFFIITIAVILVIINIVNLIVVLKNYIENFIYFAFIKSRR